MRLLSAGISFALLELVQAIGQQPCVSFTASRDSFSVVNNGRAAPIFISADDWAGVHRATTDFAADIRRVTGASPALANVSFPSSERRPSQPAEGVIIVGTLGKSSLISQVVNATQLDVSSIEGKWESFITRVVSNPIPGISRAYVIIGSDKRGTIYGLYEHSEQFGVSPWYWWADVPTTRRSSLFVSSAGCSQGPPSVQYRGIFLNDEQPALQSWAMERFNNGTGSEFLNSPFNHLFYEKVFELLLRIKANYLWPAMWGSAFGIDDPLNQYTADLYGIVMGTSHQEPMMRSSPNEWNLFGTPPWNYTSNAQNVYDYWVNGTQRARPYESLYTLGMRGEGDLPMSEETNIALLQKIVEDQRQILMDVHETDDVTTIPQMWTLYKEVQGYYEGGMRVPDDIALLWTDDNWGNIRRFPLDDERGRPGGAGVYYHFDYVGDPRSYKWITTTQISKTYEQMAIAIHRNATRVWIVNVGDLKPYELAIEFFITYGWNATRWNERNLDSFVSLWAQREFALSQRDATIVSDIVGNLTRYNARRKPEMLNGTTFSLYNYREADRVLDEWRVLSEASTRIYNRLPAATRIAYFELVHHAVLASSTLGAMWIYQGMNNLRASQARLSTNELAKRVEDLFEEDYRLEDEYHNLLDGKWNHMLDQTHVMYYYWQQPMANTMPPITRVQGKKQALPGPMRIALEGTPGAWPGDNPNQCTQGYNCPPPSLTLDRFTPINSRYIDVGSGGPNSFTFTLSANVSWLRLSPSRGSISPRNTEQRVFATVDWSAVPEGTSAAAITLTANARGQPEQSVTIGFQAVNTSPEAGFRGFVEGDGGISIEAAHAQRNTTVNGVTWSELPGHGKTVSAITPLPQSGNGGNAFEIGSGPVIEYDFFNFNTIASSGNITVTALVSPSLNANGEDRPLAFAVQVDDLLAQRKQPIPNLAKPGDTPPGWGGSDGFVANSIVSVPSTFVVSPGRHTLKIWMIEPAVVIQKIVINSANVRPSYLGPPESIIV